MIPGVESFLEQYHMIEQSDVVVAGVSGGADSVCLLLHLLELKEKLSFTLAAVHVQHGIRGEESLQDAAFVEELCRRYQVQLFRYDYDVPEYAKQHGYSEEEAGRNLRYESFHKALEELGAPEGKIAVAHNRNDLAETMLHHLARGTGLRGLSGIHPCSDGIIRPVLCLERREIVYYLEENEISYITDSSNLSDGYTRNRIRHHVLPAMEKEINGKTVEHMAETARILREADGYLRRKGAELLEQCRQKTGYLLDGAFFEKPDIVREYAVMEAFERLSGKRKDFTSLHVRQVFSLQKKETGRYIKLPGNIQAVRSYGGVRLEKTVSGPGTTEGVSAEKKGSGNPAEMFFEIPLSGILECPFGIFETKIFHYKNQKIEEKKYTKWMDYDKIKGSPCVRTRKQGDYLVVNSAGGRKKLNRIFIDEKIPAGLRDQIPVVAAGSEILWIPGGRMNEQYKITSTTGRVLELHYQGGVLT